MLDDGEFKEAKRLYNEGCKNANHERFKSLLDYYNTLTGFNETEAAAIMHHQISQYGPNCEKCGKPYRTPKAAICASCGNKRVT